jgi:hypothetical protein
MDIAGMLQSSGALNAVAGELGIDQATAARGATALLPAILGGFRNQAASAGGVGGLGSILGALGGGSLLDSVVGPQATPVDQGHAVLGTIFGGNDVNDQVTAQAAQQSGIDPAIIRQLLPVVAMLVAGYFAHQQAGTQPAAPVGAPATSGGLGGILGQVLGSVMGGGQAAAPAAAPAAGGLGSLGGLASMLDMNHDGNPLDDILGMAGRLTGR